MIKCLLYNSLIKKNNSIEHHSQKCCFSGLCQTKNQQHTRSVHEKDRVKKELVVFGIPRSSKPEYEMIEFKKLKWQLDTVHLNIKSPKCGQWDESFAHTRLVRQQARRRCSKLQLMTINGTEVTWYGLSSAITY